MKPKSIVTILSLLCSSTVVMAQEKPISDIIQPYEFETRYADLNDSTRIAYVDEGAGDKALLFVHGLATYLPSWKKNIKELKKKYRCIALDLPGYGRSSKAVYPATMSFYATTISQFLEEIDIDKVVLVGHSMGAHIGLMLVLEYPEKVESLVLAAPAGFETFSEQDKQWFKEVFTPEVIASATPQQVQFNYALNFFEMPADVGFMITDRVNMVQASDFELYCKVVAGGVTGMLTEPVFDRLGEVQQPVMVTYGANDALIPNRILHKNMTTREIAETGTKKLHDGQLQMIPKCGHFVPFEKPDIFNEIIVEFLSGQ